MDGMLVICCERDVAEQRHPIVFHHFAGSLGAGYGGRWLKEELMRVGPFHIKSQTGLRVRQFCISSQGNSIPIVGLACFTGVEESAVRVGLHFADGIVRKSLRVVSD